MILQVRFSPCLIIIIVLYYTGFMTKNQQPYLYKNRLREHRKKHKLLQSQVAQLLGFTSTDRISFWERGTAAPSIVNLFKLCHIYRASPFDLYHDLTDITDDEIEGRRIEVLLRK